MTRKKFSTKFLVEMALLVAIILIMAFTPLGYIKTAGIEITLIVVPVAVGAVTLGPAAGAILGGVFGLASFLRCFGLNALPDRVHPVVCSDAWCQQSIFVCDSICRNQRTG